MVRCRPSSCHRYSRSQSCLQNQRTIPQARRAASQTEDEHRSSTRDAGSRRQTCQNEPHRSYRQETLSYRGPWKAKGCNLHDLVRVIQFCKPNDECQHSQHNDGDLASTPGLHVLFDGTSISLNGSRIQLSRAKIGRCRTHGMVEVCGQTFALFVRIFANGAWFDGGRPPVPRAEAAKPGWTSWGGHDIAVYLTQSYTCPQSLGAGVSCVLGVCRWQGKYGCTLSEGSAADRKRYGEGAEGGEGESG